MPRKQKPDLLTPEQVETTAEATAETVVKRHIKQLTEENRLLRGIMTGVIIVLFVGFLSLIVALGGVFIDSWTQYRLVKDYLNEKKEAYSLIHGLRKDVEEIKSEIIKTGQTK